MNSIRKDVDIDCEFVRRADTQEELMMQVVGHVVKIDELKCRRRNEARDERKNQSFYAENLMNIDFDFGKGLNILKCTQQLKSDSN